MRKAWRHAPSRRGGACPPKRRWVDEGWFDVATGPDAEWGHTYPRAKEEPTRRSAGEWTRVGLMSRRVQMPSGVTRTLAQRRSLPAEAQVGDRAGMSCHELQ